MLWSRMMINKYPYFENKLPSAKPPTLYAIMNSLVNFGKEKNEKVKISDLPEEARELIFDFNYPYPSIEIYPNSLPKEIFEQLILTHFIDRRIGFETFTTFKLHLMSKLYEVIPSYMYFISNCYDADFSHIFGNEIIERSYSEETSGENSASTVDKFSDTPQGQLNHVDEDTYLTDYRDISGSGEESGSKEFTETITRYTPLEIYTMLLNSKNRNVFTNLLNEFEDLFYQLA